MYLFIFVLIYFFLIFFLTSYIVWRRTGINPFTFNSEDDAHGYNGKLFKIISVIEFGVVIIYAFIPDWYQFLLPVWYLDYEYLLYIGWALLIMSLILVLIAQNHMADSWRVGIDENNKTELVTSGLFSISRNPIFLGIAIANIGLFMIVPNAFTLLIVALSSTSMNTQIRLEEHFLKSEFGQEYLRYLKKVRRWI